VFHRLRELAGAKKVRLTPARRTVSGLIESFLSEYPQAVEEMLDADGAVSFRYMIIVNGQLSPQDEWEETPLADGDEVAFLTMIAGG